MFLFHVNVNILLRRVILLLLLTASTLGYSAEITIAENGNALAKIVVLPNAGPVANFAATELKHYLDKVTGANFDIVNSLPADRPVFIIGLCEPLASMEQEVLNLKRDGFLIKQDGQIIAILGRDDLGFDVESFLELTDNDPIKGWKRTGHPECATLYGVYSFLEKIVGLRWYFPGNAGEYVPEKTTLTVPELDIKEEPRFIYRWPYRLGHRSADPNWPNDMNDYVEMGITDSDVTYWALRNRRSSIHIPVNHMPSGHHFIDRFGTEHPDWFSQREDGSRENYIIQGESATAYGHLCYSQSNLVQAVIADVDAFFSGLPASSRGLTSWNSQVANGDYYSLLPHDYLPTGCYCATCMSKKNTAGPARGLLSDLIWGYVAEVGQSIVVNHPDKKLVCLAYNAYRGLPQNVVLPQNVLPCPTALHTGNAADNIAMANIIQEINDWESLASQPIGLWVYSAMECLDGDKIRGIPENEFHAMGRFYKAVKDDVIGSFWENDWKYGFQHHLDLYMYFQLTWNPDVNTDQIIQEYCQNFYGPAAGEIRQFLNRVEELWTTEIVKPRIGADSGSGAAYADIYTTSAIDIWENIYNANEMASLENLLNTAATKVANSEYEARFNLFKQYYWEPLKELYDKEHRTYGDLLPLKVFRCKVAPVIDGKPDDAVWQLSSTEYIGEMIANDPSTPIKTPEQQTTVRLCWDETRLYVLLACHESLLDQLQAPQRSFNDFDIINDDEVEVFLDHYTNQQNCYNFLVNAAGSVAHRYLYNNGDSTPKIQNGFQSEVWVDPSNNMWYAELSFTFNQWIKKPQVGEKWPANFSRTRQASGVTQLNTWSPLVQGAFYQLDKFCLIEFMAEEQKVFRCTVPPVIDGDPNDVAWQFSGNEYFSKMIANAPSTTDKTPEEETIIRLCWDDTYLYVLFACHESLINELQAPQRSFNDFDIINDDEIEVFLDHYTNQQNCYNFLVNATGSAAHRYLYNNGDSIPKIQNGFQSATWIDYYNNIWYAELRFTFGQWIKKPEIGDKWPTNFSRTRQASSETQLNTWSPLVQGSFNQLDKFNLIEFVAESN